MYKILDNLWLGATALVVQYIYPFIFPVKGFLIFTGAVVLCDTVTGILAAHKRGEPISSKGMRRTITKIIIYFIAILLAEGMRVTFVPGVSIPYAVAFVIATTEFKSNIENIESISGISLWATITSTIKNAAKNYTDPAHKD